MRSQFLHVSSRFVQCHPCWTQSLIPVCMHVCFHWVLLTILATPPCNGEFEITFAFSHTLLWFSNLTQYAAIVAAFAPKPNHKLNLVHTFVQSSGIYQHFPIGSVGDKLETKMNTLRQEARIDALMRKFETLEGQLQQVMAEMKDEIQTIGNETNMVHDLMLQIFTTPLLRMEISWGMALDSHTNSGSILQRWKGQTW